MLPNLTLCRSGCTVDNSWDELPDDLRRLVLNKSKSRPMLVRVVHSSRWLIKVQLVEEGVAPPLTGRWELTYDGYERFGSTEPGFQARYREEDGFSHLSFSVPGASQAAERIRLLLLKPEYSIRKQQRLSLIRYANAFEEWRLNVPLAGSPRDTDLMAKLIGKSAPEAFDLLFQAMRRDYIRYPLSALLRQSILENLDKFARKVRAYQEENQKPQSVSKPEVLV